MPPFLGKERLRWKLALNTPEFSVPQVMPLDLLHLVIHLLRSLSISLLQLIFHLLLRVMLPFEVCWRLSRPFRWHMDKFWWMCLLSFKIYVWIWRVFGILLCLHLLMMSLHCPLAIHHKKRGVFMHVNRGRFRLYLGDSWCIHFFFFFGSWCIFFYWLYMLGGDICALRLVFLLFLVSHMVQLIIALYLWGYSWYIFLFLCEIKNLFILLVFFIHAFMCLLSVSGIYRFI